MVDPNNERLLDVESKGQAALDELNAAYDSAITSNTTTQTELLNKIDANTAEQKAAQQKASDLAIQKIEQDKEWAKNDYQKEQRGAYVDWKKQSDPYGVKAEQMAASGLANTGYAESSQVAMYTAYQNRIATAREAYTRAVVSYDTAIAEAKATNSVALAEIASKALEASLNIAVQFAMQNNSLLVQKANAANTIRQNTISNYLDVYGQLQDEAQFNASLAEERRQFDITNSLKGDLQIEKDGEGNSEIEEEVNPEFEEELKKAEAEVNARAKEKMKDFNATTYEAAYDFLRKNNVSDFNLMTKSEWARRKSSYNQTGIGGYQVSAHDSYKDYLEKAVEYALTGNYK